MNLPISIQAVWPAVLFAAVPLLFWLAGRSRTRLGRKHLLVATALRGLAIFSLALALMRPQWNAGSGDVSVVYALDVSRSVSSSFIEGAIEWIERADREGAPAHARYLAFADHAVLLRKLEDVRNLPVTEGRAQAATEPGVIDQSATNLEQALDTALLGLDRDRAKRIVLLTDGNQTAGDVWRALPQLTRAHVRVYPIPAQVRGDNDAWVAGIDVPENVNAGEPITVAVRVFSAGESPARVLLKDASRLLGMRKVQLRTGVNRVAFEVRLARTGSVTLSAEVLAKGDRVTENNRMQQSVWVSARPRILYVEGGQSESARYLTAALDRQGLEVHAIAPAAIPASASELADYDAVILSDVSAKALAPEQMQAIQS
jgi:Ca-activated chloride channel homolog